MTACLTLYCDGKSGACDRLAAALRAWCDRELRGGYRLEVVDVTANPGGAARTEVLAVPALSLLSSGRLVVGDVGDVAAAMAAIGCPVSA
jgi:hypothetical protein